MKSIIERAQEKRDRIISKKDFDKLSIEDKKLFVSSLSENDQRILNGLPIKPKNHI